MSVMYCNYCNIYIDTDYDVEHFIVDEATQCYAEDENGVHRCINMIEDYLETGEGDTEQMLDALDTGLWK